MTKDQAEAANWAFAHTWHDGLGLEFAGVDLGDCVTYRVLMVLGNIWKQNFDRLEQASEQPKP